MNKNFEDTNKDELGNSEGRFMKFSDLLIEKKNIPINQNLNKDVRSGSNFSCANFYDIGENFDKIMLT